MSKLIETNELIKYVCSEMLQRDQPRASFYVLCDIAKSLAIIADETKEKE